MVIVEVFIPCIKHDPLLTGESQRSRKAAIAAGKNSLNTRNARIVIIIFHTTVGDLFQQVFLLLFKLLSYPNKIFTRRQLMDEIWDMDSESDERTVDVHISRLRDRFRSNEDFSIITVRGLGYKAVYLK